MLQSTIYAANPIIHPFLHRLVICLQKNTLMMMIRMMMMMILLVHRFMYDEVECSSRDGSGYLA